MTLGAWFRLVLPAMAALLLATEAAAAPIPGLYTTFGSNSESTLARINPDTGFVTVIGPIVGADVGMVGGLAYDSRHEVLYGVAWSRNYLGGNYWSSLFRIDPATASAELVGATGHISVAGLAYDSNSHVLYGGAGDFPQNYLVRIDRATGAGMRIGGGPAEIAALEYLPRADRMLYVQITAEPPNSTLWEMNRTTGAGTLIGPMGAGGVYGMAYDPTTDRLYGLPGSSTGANPGFSLLTIDPGTGLASRHRNLSLGGLYNSMAYVPEPMAGAATLVGAAGLIACRRRTRRATGSP